MYTKSDVWHATEKVTSVHAGGHGAFCTHRDAPAGQNVTSLYRKLTEAYVHEQSVVAQTTKGVLRPTCAAMNFGFMKELPVTIPLLAFSRILHSIKQSQTQTNVTLARRLLDGCA